jgi:hypothetical protein
MFSTYFPTKLQDLSTKVTIFDTSEYQTPPMLQTRVHLIHAISKAFKCPEANSVEFMSYIDALFNALLRPDIHILLQIAVVHALHTSLPLTNRNRLRVDKYFKSRIIELSKLMFHFQSTGSLKAKEVSLKSQLMKELHKFWTKWYPRPSDATIISELGSLEQTGSKFAEGYVQKRTQWITNGATLETILSANPPKTPQSRLGRPTSKVTLSIRKGRTKPYTEIEDKILEPSLFPEIVEKDGKPILFKSEPSISKCSLLPFPLRSLC